jgi:hypothetical protein
MRRGIWEGVGPTPRFFAPLSMTSLRFCYTPFVSLTRCHAESFGIAQDNSTKNLLSKLDASLPWHDRNVHCLGILSGLKLPVSYFA